MDEQDIGSLDVCNVCREDCDNELVVLCEGCPAQYHTYCLTGCLCCRRRPNIFGRIPPVPEGDFFCKHCAGRVPKPAKRSAGTKVWAWGSNEGGQLGIGKSSSRESKPVPVPELEGLKIAALSLGGWNTSLLSMDGRVYTVGDGDHGKTGHPDVVHEQLTHFRLVEALLPENTTKNEGAVVNVCQGRDFALAVTAAGHLYSWGHGHLGQLGHQNYNDSKVPKKNSALRETETEVSALVACGWAHAVALGSQRGECMAWGGNSNGQLGLGDTCGRSAWVPKTLNPAKRLAYGPKSGLACKLGYTVCMVACGKSHTLALTTDGQVWTWGAAMMGQLGHGLENKREIDPDESSDSDSQDDSLTVLYPEHKDHSCPKQVEALAKLQVRQICAGANHSLALTKDKVAYAWGFNKHGELGLGDDKNRHKPTRVEALAVASARPVALAAGDHHSVALSAKGKVYTWGKGSEGQLGRGSLDHSMLPAIVAGLPTVERVFAGGDHVFCIKGKIAISQLGPHVVELTGDGEEVDLNWDAELSEDDEQQADGWKAGGDWDNADYDERTAKKKRAAIRAKRLKRREQRMEALEMEGEEQEQDDASANEGTKPEQKQNKRRSSRSKTKPAKKAGKAKSLVRSSSTARSAKKAKTSRQTTLSFAKKP